MGATAVYIYIIIYIYYIYILYIYIYIHARALLVKKIEVFKIKLLRLPWLPGSFFFCGSRSCWKFKRSQFTTETKWTPSHVTNLSGSHFIHNVDTKIHCSLVPLPSCCHLESTAKRKILIPYWREEADTQESQPKSKKKALHECRARGSRLASQTEFRIAMKPFRNGKWKK